MVECGVDNLFMVNGVHKHIDKEDLPLGNGKTEKVEWNVIGRGVEDRGHSENGEACFMEHLTSLPARIT